jgi:hypothetical protein
MENDLNKNLEDYMKFYMSLSNPQFAVLINGKWGSGKTFYIKAKVDKWNSVLKKSKNNSIAQKTSFWNKKDKQKEDEEIVLKPLYISLYGVSSTSQISEKIKEALNPLFYTKGAKIIKNILLGAVKTATHINLDTDGDGKSDGKVSFNVNSIGLLKGGDDRIKGEKLIIFDDLERCKLKISELFGYINEFVEHYSCKVILLSEESKIFEKCEEEKEAYKEFKEKLVGQTFIIQADIEKAIDAFINKLSASKEKEFLENSKGLIKSVFESSKIENLRILRQSILDFERFVNQFDSSLKEHKKYQDFLKNLLGHFVLVYLEFKSGNDTISNLSNYSFAGDQKENEQKIRSKYDEVLDKYGVYHRMSVIQYSFIIDFINNGYSNVLKLNTSIKENGFFRDSEEKDWEKLWRWEELEDNEFKNSYNKVIDSLKKEEIENPYILLHVITILISLKNKGIIESTEFDLVDVFKNRFEKILDKHKNEPFSRFGEQSWSKGYRERESEEFKEIINYSNNRIIEHNSQNKDDYLKKVFENINNENISQLQEKLDAPLPDRSSNYSFIPILTTVDGKKLASSLLKLTNKNLDLFFYFLNRRYYPEKIYSNGYLEPFNAQDKKCFIEIKNKFEDEIDLFSKIKKHNLRNHINFLIDLIQKLEKLETADK